MSDDYKIQLSSKINGNLLNLRANSGDELKDVVVGLATNLDDIITAFAQIKEGVILKDLFTGDAEDKGGKPSGRSTSSGDSGTPRCKHGEMKDLRSKNYKSDFYCPEPDRDKQCKPVKL